MTPLFGETVECWEDWGRVFQSIPAFSGLIREILRREGLPFSSLEGLTPGTNAVFRSGGLVVKVFFPRESGLDPVPDFEAEAAVCAWLTRHSIPTPRLLAGGFLEDRYRFYYLVTEYFPGKEAGGWLRGASREEKRAFARKLRGVLQRLNRPAEGLLPPVDLLGRAAGNPRLRRLPAGLVGELRARVQGLDLSQRVLVHGDLTGENLLVDGQGDPVVIDCADACLAPAWYEYGPIAFELFQCDPVLLSAFAGEDRIAFAERVLDSVSLHAFGADLLEEAARREGIPVFSDLGQVRRFLLERLSFPD